MSSPPPSLPISSHPSSFTSAPPAEASERLARQLQALSEVVETITYRLLELEERLAGQDLRLQALTEQAPAGSAAAAEAQGRLDDTEERLGRIESLLSGADGAGVSGRLSLVSAPRSRGSVRPAPTGSDASLGDVEDIDGAFPDEPEQPFLDELETDLEADPDGGPGYGEPPARYLTA